MKNNKLIAEFMGVKPTILGDEITYEMYGIVDCIEDGLDEQHFFLEEELHFHTSWDWLMPVVQKCLDVSNDDNIEDFYSIQNVVPNREATYKAVVEFINEHNKYICGSCGDNVNKVVFNEDADVDECTNCTEYYDR
tara:strand:- start:781 stop:1188 length:408 start_codon:yes stop_codon:yes gene_type:complete